MAHAAAAVLAESRSVEEIKAPACEAITLMRARGWPPEQALLTCKRVCMSEGISIGTMSFQDNKAQLSDRLVSWLVDCYFD